MRASRFRPGFDLMGRRITPSSYTPTPAAEVADAPSTILQYTTDGEAGDPGEVEIVTTLDDWMVSGSPPVEEVDHAEPVLILTDWVVADPR